MGIWDKLHVYLMVVRPHIIAGGILGYALGVLMALYVGAKFDLISITLGYATILLWDLSTHFNNNYYDVELDKGAQGKTFGGKNILIDYPKYRSGALRISVIFSVLSICLSFVMVYWLDYSSLLLFLILGNNLLGWLYSTPPFKLNSSVIGELVLAVGTGFTVPSVGFLVVNGQLSVSFLWLCVSLVLYGMVLGLSLAFPDVVRDEVYGRRNLTAFLGWKRVAFLVLFLTLLALAVLVYVSGFFVGLWVLPFFGLFPVLAGVYGVFRVPDSFIGADKVSVVYVLSLFIFLICFDVWLFLII